MGEVMSSSCVNCSVLGWPLQAKTNNRSSFGRLLPRWQKRRPSDGAGKHEAGEARGLKKFSPKALRLKPFKKKEFFFPALKCHPSTMPQTAPPQIPPSIF